ncbi:hypothetical protein EVAR_91280_1 [Eumeta japonica]|uniref:Uncharacterized protein n=1 Tax=Eumeta variegata TaxID=151549 RepID=A0A4C1TF69_EUMVA|nr:hypothetical protein EVAR_91280_1 [Eumeta japonica]
MRLPDFGTLKKMLEEEANEEIQSIRDDIRGMAIKRTQYGVGLKLKDKYLGPYRVVRKLRHDRYEVEKVGEGEGPRHTSTVSEYMKWWSSVFEPNTGSGGPNVGSEH